MNWNTTADVVFLLNVDNTLLDNDRILADLRSQLEGAFGLARAARYWLAFESLRAELGYADYLGALQRYRVDTAHGGCDDEQLLLISSFLIDYPFAERLYPHALDGVAHLGRLGPTVILSDGDVVFQPRNVQRSGVWDAADGRVLINVHKDLMLDAVQRQHPARRYVMIDDKQRLLAAMKAVPGNRLTTVFPRQGHYALDPVNAGMYPAADFAVDHIGDLLAAADAVWLSRATPPAGSA